MPRDRDKNNASPRGSRGTGRYMGKNAGKGRESGSERTRDERPFRYSGKPFGDKKPGTKRPYAVRPASDRPRQERPFAAKGAVNKGGRFRNEGERPNPRFNRNERSPARSRDERPHRGPRKDFTPREDRGGEGRSHSKPRDNRGHQRTFAPRKRDDRAPYGERNDARPTTHFAEKRFTEKKFGDKRPYGEKRSFGARSSRAFSSEVDTGSREENASKQKDRAAFRFNRNGKSSSAKDEGSRKYGAPRKSREDFAGYDRSKDKPWERHAAPARDKVRRDIDERPRFSRLHEDRPDRNASGDRGSRNFSHSRNDRRAGDRQKFDRPKFDRPRGDRETWQEHPRSESREARPRGAQDDSKIFVKRPAFGGRGPWRERKPEPDRRERSMPPEKKKTGMRIAKQLARAGLCSRRDAEDWIMQGRVAVNGRVITSPALDVTERDRVTVDGKPLPERERTRLFLYHKPRGLMTTHADPEGRPTVFDNLPEHLPRLISVGRLDFNTEGLLLLTNDGGLARVLELPDTGWLRRYRVRAHGSITQAQLDELRHGVEVEGVKYGSIDAQLEHDQGANVWIVFAIREGKNREVRNVLAHLGLEVNRLIRVSYGPFQLAELSEGEVEEVKTRMLREQLGDKMIALAGAEFNILVKQSGSDEDETLLHREDKQKKSRSRTGLIADRKGRRVLVERSGEHDKEPRPTRRSKRAYHGKRDIKPR